MVKIGYFTLTGLDQHFLFSEIEIGKNKSFLFIFFLQIILGNVKKIYLNLRKIW